MFPIKHITLMRRYRILLADDHPLILSGLKSVIDHQPDLEVVGEASSGQEAIRLTERLSPDLVLLDISMPGSGPHVVQTLKTIRPELFVLMVTVHDEEHYVQRMLRAGASGYLLKQSADTEVVQAIYTLLKGLTYLDPTLTTNLARRYIVGPASKTTPRPVSLTIREEDVARQTAGDTPIRKLPADSISVLKP